MKGIPEGELPAAKKHKASHFDDSDADFDFDDAVEWHDSAAAAFGMQGEEELEARFDDPEPGEADEIITDEMSKACADEAVDDAETRKKVRLDEGVFIKAVA